MNNTFESVLKWGKSNWWIILLIVLVIMSLIFTLFGLNGIVDKWADSLAKMLTPASIIIGLVLGYPLLKRKLTEGYIAKQFDIMDDANRVVRAKCIQLQDKYISANRSTDLTIEYITEAKNDILELKQLSIDATPDVYRYINLLYQALVNMEKYFRIHGESFHFYYKEQLSTWLNEQLHETYDYSKTIGVIPTGATSSKQRLNKRLSKFVSDNSFVEIDNLNRTIDYFHNSSMLVIFYAKNNAVFSKDHLYLYKACFKAAPSPSPYARLMYNSCIYFPPMLKGKKKLLLDYPELYLVGYSRMTSGSFDGGAEETYYICTYANISNISFVEGTIHDLDSLKEYDDGYLNLELPLENITKFKKCKEFIQFRISEEDTTARYNNVAYRLQCKLKEEMRP